MSAQMIEISMFHAHLEAGQVLSALREAAYKLATAHFNAGDRAAQQAAYALADKYQAAIDALGDFSFETATVTVEGWGEE